MTQDNAQETGSSRLRATFSLPVGGAFLQASAELPVGRTTLTEMLPLVQDLENAIIGRIWDEAREAGSPISCRAGCGACCRQLVPVSLFEAEALTTWMETLPDDRRALLESRFHDALSALRDGGVIDSLLDDSNWQDEGGTARLAIDYFHAGVACPFLVDESCSIHPIRPLSCREYLVTSPPELCRDPSEHAVSGVQLPMKLSRILFRFGQEMEQDRRGWIPLVFLLAWGKSGATPGDHVAGTGEEVLRRILKQAAELVEQQEKEEAAKQRPT